MANTKQLQSKKLGLLKQKSSIEALQATYTEKITKINADIAEVNSQLEAEVAELQRMIDEIKNGATTVATPVAESESDAEFN